MVIILDPGHYYNYNQSPVKSSYYEGNMSFKLAYFLKEELEKYNCKVIVTRKTIYENPTLEARGKFSGQYKADLFLSLHSNAVAGKDYIPNGVEVIYSMKDVSWNKSFACKLIDIITQVTGMRKRSAYTRAYPNTTNVDYYGVIRSSAASGCTKAFLIEHGFHTNINDVEKLSKDETLKAIAKAEASLIAKEFSLSSSDDKTSNTTSKPELYRIRKSWKDASSQIGAYSVFENAKKALVGHEGYSVFNSVGNKVYPLGTLWLGKPVLTKAQCINALRKNNPNFTTGIVNKYYAIAEKYGIRADLAFCQACVETGWFRFTGTVKATQNNFCGLGVVSSTNSGCSFTSITSGVEAHIQHIYAYASTEVLPQGEILIDPRFKYVSPRGKGPTVESFNNSWAMSTTYSDTIFRVYEAISKF